MIDQQAVIDHLQAAVPLARVVEHAYSMEAVDNPSETTPALYIYPGGESSADSETPGLVTQQSDAGLVVLIVAHLAELDAVRAQVLAALIGYQVDPICSAMVHQDGVPKDVRAGYVFWRDRFSTTFQRRQGAN